LQLFVNRCAIVCCEFFKRESHPNFFLAAGPNQRSLGGFWRGGELGPVGQFPVFLSGRTGIGVIGSSPELQIHGTVQKIAVEIGISRVFKCCPGFGEYPVRPRFFERFADCRRFEFRACSAGRFLGEGDS